VNWKVAKQILSGMDFPEGRDFGEEVRARETHGRGKEIHSLLTYELYLPKIEGLRALARYNFCPECRSVRNKYLVLFNDEENVCYQKWFVRHGKEM